MAQPTPYDRQYNFDEYQALHPSDPLPGNELDNELNSVRVTLDQTLTNLALIQRDDSRLANSSVGRDQLDPTISLGFNTPQAWATNTNFTTLDAAFFEGIFYRCLVSHLSGVFATDLAAGKWEEIANLNDFAVPGPPGANGANGANGTNGTNGVDGITPATLLAFDSDTTDADPGAGNWRFNHATVLSATAAYLNNSDALGASITAWLDSFDDNNDTTRRGVIEFRDVSTPAVFAKFLVTGSVVDGTGYRKLTLAHIASSGAFAGQAAVTFVPAGDKGAAGAGSGDVISDDTPTTTVENILGWSTTDKRAKGKALAALLAGGGIMSVQKVFGPWSGVALAGTTDVSAANTLLVKITAGTGPVTSFGVTRDGWVRIVRADVAFTITRDATNLETPNGADVSVGAGDVLIVVRESSEAAAKTQVIAIFKSDGRAYRGPNDIPQNLSFSGIISPTQLTANTNDWAPTGLQTALVLRLSTDASRNLTGLTAPTSGRAEARILTNVGSQNLVLKNEDALSTAANRFSLGADFTLTSNKTIILWYDTTSSRWRSLSQDFAVGGLALLDRVTTIDQNLSLTGVISPAQLTANTNNWAPTGFATASRIRASTDASRDLTGVAGGADGRIIFLDNVGSNGLVLKNEDALSTAANRFAVGSDRTLAGGDAALLVYDGTSLRWRIVAIYATGGGGGGTTHYGAADGRLTLSTGTPVMLSAVTAATTLYYTPYVGGQIGLYDGSAWSLVSFTQKSIGITQSQTGTTTSGSAIITGLTDTSQLIVGMKVSGTGVGASAAINSINSATQVTLSVNSTANGTNTITFKLPASTNFDVFGFNNSGALKLEFVKWTNDTTRATALVAQDGVLVKTGATTRRFLGTIRTTATDGQSEFSFGGSAAGGTAANLLVYNHYNKVPFNAGVYDSTASWTYGTASWRAANNSSTMRANVVLGYAGAVTALYSCAASSPVSAGGPKGQVGVGVDSTTAVTGGSGIVGAVEFDASVGAAVSTHGTGHLPYMAAAGFHYFSAIEKASVATGNVTFYGALGSSAGQNVLSVSVEL